MVVQLIWPKEGGGSLRRFLGIRQRLLNAQHTDPRPLRGPMTLFDFRQVDDAADVRESLNPNRTRGLFGGWRVSDDGVIGGYSTSRMEFNEGVFTNNEGGKGAADSDGSTEAEDSASSPPFLRWSGTISTKINHQSQLSRNVTRSGFAAILSPEYPLSAPLGNKYRALEICCRTDGRTYAVNLHVETMFPEDMYQGFIVGGGNGDGNGSSTQVMQQSAIVENVVLDHRNDSDIGFNDVQQSKSLSIKRPKPSLDVREHLKNRQQYIQSKNPSNTDTYHGYPPHGFQRLVLPFTNFALTSRGRLRHTQRDLDGSVNIESIGFTLMDGKDGDFCFDLLSLRAVNVLQGEVVGTLDEDEREDELRDILKNT